MTTTAIGEDSESPLNPIQAALVELLAGDATLTTLMGPDSVHDQVPEGDPYPYIRLGEHLSVPANDLTSFGRRVTETLHIWTKSRGNGPGQAIATRVNELLDHKTGALVIEGHKVVSIRNEFDQALTDPNPDIRHHVLRFVIETAQQG